MGFPAGFEVDGGLNVELYIHVGYFLRVILQMFIRLL